MKHIKEIIKMENKKNVITLTKRIAEGILLALQTWNYLYNVNHSPSYYFYNIDTK